MGYLTVLLAAVAGFATGSVWYMTLGKLWQAALGPARESAMAQKSPLPFIVGFLANLATAGMMRHIFATTAISGAGMGLIAGLGIGLFMTAPWILTNYAFANRDRTLWWIDAGHAAAATAVIGLVLGAMA